MKTSEWIDRYGEQAVEDLARRMGGRRVYIPIHAGLHPDLLAALGDQAEQFKFLHQGQRMEIPVLLTVQREVAVCRARDSARRLIASGLSDRAVMKATGLGRSTIDKIRSNIQ